MLAFLFSMLTRGALAAESHAMSEPGVVSIYVATQGVDVNPGTLEAPVASLQHAVALAEGQPAPAEIVVRGGRYVLEQTVVIQRSARKSRLMIRAAENENPVFDGSIRIEKAEPLEGAAGVFAVKGRFPTDEPPSVWEESTGRFFNKLAALDSVQATDDSTTVLDDQTLAIRCKDGLNPAVADIRMSRAGMSAAVIVRRNNVTVKGLEFRNFCLSRSSGALWIGGAGRERDRVTGVVVDSCSAINCHKGFWEMVSGVNSLITRCRVRNAQTGIWLSGTDPVVEHCSVVNDLDFMRYNSKAFGTLDHAGIRAYNECRNATIRHNFIEGFLIGIFCKNGRGVFRVENNTALYPPPVFGSRGYAMRPDMRKEYSARYNVFVGFPTPFGDAGSIPDGADIDYNIFWGPEYNQAGIVNRFKAKGIGLNNVVADPQFAAPGQADYRLLPGSPALHIHGKITAGAFAGVPDDYPGAPNLRVSLVNKEGIHGRDLYPLPGIPHDASYFSKQKEIEVKLAVSSVAPVEQVRFSMDNGAVCEREFKAVDVFELPDHDGLHTVCFRVRDANGAWSEDSVIHVTLMRKAVRMIGEPRMTVNNYGALFAFKTDGYAWGMLEYQHGGNWIQLSSSKGLAHNSDGVEENYAGYREFSSLPLLASGLAPDSTYRYRLTISTWLGSIIKEGDVKLMGRPKITYVSTSGEDAEGRGARDKPLRTIQFALDRALPGDRVRIMPGVYFGTLILNHGGTAERPLVIEGLYPNTVILDGLRDVGTCLRIDNAPNVVVRNLNFRWFLDSGVAINHSENVRVTACRFQNQYWVSDNARSPGTGMLFWRSPNFMVDHCIFTHFHYAGVVFDESSGGSVLHNTGTACEVTLIHWRGWWGPSDNVTIKYNSLNWNGNSLLIIQQPCDILRNRCEIDYNNYGTTFDKEEGTVGPGKRLFGQSLLKPFGYLPGNREFIIYEDRDRASPAQEAIPRDKRTTVFVNMEDWQEYSGQDAHSIFDDPKWIDPRAGRFDVAADSPNLLPDGKIIGALGYLGENPSLPPEIVVTSPFCGQEVKGKVKIAADASDFDGAVTHVSFFDGNTLLGKRMRPPYEIEHHFSVGHHVITAKAMDDRGGESISDAVTILVTEQ